MSRPRILNLNDDPAWGGVNRVLSLLTQSPLSEIFDIDTRIVNSRWPLPLLVPHDLIIVHYAASWRKLGHLAALRLANPRTPLLVQEHSYGGGFERHCVPNRRRFRLMLRLFYGMADRVLANSHAVADWMTEAGLVRPDRLSTIPQCWDISALMALPPPEPRSADSPLALATWGRMHRQKGFDDLIDAMALVSPQRAQLRIGGFGPDEDALRQRAAGMPHVRFVGRVDDVARFLSDVDAVVIPSRWEPFGLVALEAKAAARPVIATAVDGLVEQVAECGWVVPPSDPPSMAAAIEALTTADLIGHGLAGRLDVADAWDRFVRTWSGVMTRAIGTTG